MSLSNPNRFFRTIGFRISLWHFGILILSGISLLVIVHIILAFLFIKEDRQTIQEESLRIEAMYPTGGVQAIKDEIDDQEGKAAFFIKLTNAKGEMLALSDPGDFEDYDLTQIKSLKADENGWKKLWENPDNDFKFPLGPESMEIATAKIDDLTLLVGKTSEERMDLESRILFILGVAIVPFLLAIGTLLSHRALSPLREMISTVESIQAGKMSSRVPESGTGDELDELAKLFNQMLEQIEKLIKGMQDSLDIVAHDLRTPITRLRATAETALQSAASPDTYREALADCMEETEQILSMLETLMDISEAQTGAMKLNTEKISVLKLIEDSIDLYSHVAEDRGLTIESSCPDDLYVNVDSRRMRQALVNLVDNAMKYTPRGGRILLEAHQQDGQAVISIADTGSGISSQDLPKIWERLYRSNNAQTTKGIGLGLSLVRAIIQSHGGQVTVASELNKGSTFSIHLPLTSNL
jgi:signal transduction histidine kinase